MSNIDNVIVKVCAHCRCVSCWAGELFCENARSAPAIEVSRFMLMLENREHKTYLSDAYIRRITGAEPRVCEHDYERCGSAMGEVHMSKCNRRGRVAPTNLVAKTNTGNKTT